MSAQVDKLKLQALHGFYFALASFVIALLFSFILPKEGLVVVRIVLCVICLIIFITGAVMVFHSIVKQSNIEIEDCKKRMNV